MSYKKLQGVNQINNLTAIDQLWASLLNHAEEYDEAKWRHPITFQHGF
jgi:hypothetical protein